MVPASGPAGHLGDRPGARACHLGDICRHDLSLARRLAGVGSVRDGRANRDLRLGSRWSHRGARHPRPAAARAGALRRATRRTSRTGRSRSPRSARHALDCLDRMVADGVKAARHRVQQRLVRVPARRPRALRRPGGRGDPPGGAPRGRGHPQRPGRRDRHDRHDHQRRVRRRVRRRPARAGDQRRPARSSSSSSSAGSPPAGRCSASPRPTWSRCSGPRSTRSCSAARTTRCSPACIGLVMGDGRHAGVQRGRDGQGGLPRAHRAGPAASRPDRHRSTGSSPPATRSRSPGSPSDSSAGRCRRPDAPVADAPPG